MSIPLARRLLRVLSARLRPVLDAAARQRRDHRTLGRDVAGQHRQARHRIRPGVSRALRGRAAAARRAVLARPGAEQLRRLHLAAHGSWVYRAAPLDMLGEPLRYRITLEPTNQRWMFALDTVAASPRRDMFLSHDRQLTAHGSHHQRDQLRRGVAPADALHRAADRSRAATTRPGCPRTAIRAPWHWRTRCARAPAATPSTRAPCSTGSAASGLEYTLEPGVTSIDSVDTTLFDTQKGFCGHFASAYATMMRAAGVPARIVTGYLGGEWNPVGGYFIVRQSEAHAWTEVWLDGQGWTRIDPDRGGRAGAPGARRVRSDGGLAARDVDLPAQHALAQPHDAVVGRLQPVVAGQCGRIQPARAARLAAAARHRIAADGSIWAGRSRSA